MPTELATTYPATAPVAARPKRNVWAFVGVGLLLAFYVVMTLTASRHKGLSFDEGEQIAVGYDMWTRRDFRMETANGDLVKRWATLPLLVSRPTYPSAQNSYWREQRPYVLAFNFFFTHGNDPQVLLLECRTMVCLLGIATGLLVFWCARELFGLTGGLISLTIFVSSPSMLAFGGLVSTEMTTCLTLLGCAWCNWRLLHRVTWGRLLGSLGFTALLVLSKPTAVIMFPVTSIMIAVKLAGRRPLVWQIGALKLIRSRPLQSAIFAGLLMVHVVVGWAAVWTAYDFRFQATPNGFGLPTQLTTSVADPVDPTIAGFLRWSTRVHFLPEGYIRGVKWLLAHNESQVAFMNGQWKIGGWPTFFPYAMWAKTGPALLLLVFLAAAGWWWGRRLRPTDTATGEGPKLRGFDVVYAATPFGALILVYFSVALTWDMNIGFRYVLPIYPAVYVLAGGTAYLWAAGRRAVQIAIALLLAWHVSGPISIYPHFLAYFSPLVGGPAQGYKHLVDSSLDWGMDLPGFKQWLEVHNPGNREPVYFAYFGVGNPDYYGIKSFRLPGAPDWRTGKSYPLTPGIYAISATLLESVGTFTPGPWNRTYEATYRASLATINEYDLSLSDPAAHAALLARYPQAWWDEAYDQFERLRFARLCAWLRHHRPPDANVGYSILIWRLSKDEVFDAGLGAPAELADKPLLLRRP